MLGREAEAPAWAEGQNFSGLTAVKENFAVGIQTPLPSIYCACSGHHFPLGTPGPSELSIASMGASFKDKFHLKFLGKLEK